MPFVGQNKSRVGGWIGDTDRGYDDSRYQYGGYANGARDERANLAYRQNNAEQRQGPQIDRGEQNQTRGIQMGSLSSLQSAAAGNTPSKAEALGQQMSDRAIRSQVSAAGNVRGGPGAQAAAFKSASQNAALQRADMNQGIQAERANEMATARGQLAQASTAARGQDIGLATSQAQLAQNQTALNDARAQQYEQLQNKVGSDQLQANLTQQQIGAQSQMAANQQNQSTAQNNANRDFDLFKGAAGLVSGGIQAIGSISDPAAKAPVMGSLSSLGLGGTGPASETFAGRGGTLSGSPTGELKAHSDFATRFASNPGAMPSDMVGKYTPSDMNGKDVFRSDEDAKEPSWTKPDDFGMRKAKEPGKDYSKQAPGSEDWARYGEPAKDEGDPDWKRGGATKRKKEKSNAFATILGGISGGYRDSMTSDPKAKREAFEAGAAHATKQITGEDMAPWPKDEEDDEEDGDEAEAGAVAAKETAAKHVAPAGSSPLPMPPPAPMQTTPAPAAAQSVAARAQSRPAAPPPAPAPSLTSQFLSMMPSDPRAKDALPLYEPEGKRLQQSLDGHGYLADEQQDDGRPSLAGPTPRYSSHDAPNSAERKKKGAPKERKMTPEEMKAAADKLGAEMRSDHQARMERGPSVKERFGEMPSDAMADAARSMEPSPYAYKEEMRPAEQAPGEVNIGPMANKMAEDPVARTAIVRDPETGMLAIDKDKGLKVVMGSLASLQEQIDAMQNDVPRAARAKKERRRGNSAQP